MSRRRSGAKRRTRTKYTKRQPRKRTIVLAVGLVLIGGVGGVWRILEEREARDATAEFITRQYRGRSLEGGQRFPGERPWRYTYVATDGAGIPAIAAAGEIVWRDDACIHGGRVLAGKILINPSSDVAMIESYIEAAAESEPVGRIGRGATGELVELPDGRTGEGNFLAWFKPDAYGDGVCEQLQYTLQAIVELDAHETLENRTVVDAAIMAEDEQSGHVRWVGKWADGTEETRPEIVIGKDNVRITVRKTGADGPSIAVASLHLHDPDETGVGP
jgi:hypothetical protein